MIRSFRHKALQRLHETAPRSAHRALEAFQRLVEGAAGAQELAEAAVETFLLAEAETHGGNFWIHLHQRKA